MLSVVVLFASLTLSWSQIPQLTKPSGDLDVAGLTAYLMQMEKIISDVKSGTQTQEEKYAAVLSSVLSKLTTTTDELNNLRNEHNATKSELEAIKTELKSTKEYVKGVAHIADLNVSSCITDRVNRTTFASIETDVSNLQRDVQSSVSNIKQLTYDLRNLNFTVEGERNLTSSFSEFHSYGQKLIYLQNTTEETQQKCKEFLHHQENMKSEIDRINQFVNTSSLSPSQSNEIEVAFQVSSSKNPYQQSGSILKFDQVDYNAGDGYDRKSGIFTAPVSGTYIFWINVVFHDNDGGYTISICKGDQKLATGFTRLRPTGNQRDSRLASTMTAVHVNKDEKIHFSLDSSTGAIRGQGYSSYGGALLHVSHE